MIPEYILILREPKIAKILQSSRKTQSKKKKKKKKKKMKIINPWRVVAVEWSYNLLKLLEWSHNILKLLSALQKTKIIMAMRKAKTLTE